MADFSKAYDKTMGHEGGYTNDPTDAGGETYKGISRVYNPSWSGWNIIDAAKVSSADPFPKGLDRNISLQNSVKDFYKDRYWDVNRLDEFSQAVSEELFDTGVNMGTGRAGKFLQQALNYLNRNGVLFADLAIDGAVGPATVGAYKKLESGDEVILLTMLNVLQGRHYMDYMDKDPRQRKYARGWFKRVQL